METGCASCSPPRSSKATSPGAAVCLRRRGSTRRRRRKSALRISGFRQLQGPGTYAELPRPELSWDQRDAQPLEVRRPGVRGCLATEEAQDPLPARAAAAQLLHLKHCLRFSSSSFPDLPGLRAIESPSLQRLQLLGCALSALLSHLIAPNKI